MVENVSPYARVLGEHRAHLHPQLRTYFDTIPQSHVGIGTGTFDVVGSRRWWLAPVLWLLERRYVLPRGWHTNVPFRVVNRTVAGRAVAERTLALNDRVFTMRDSVAMTPSGGLVDTLGAPPTVATVFDVTVTDGALHLTSTRIGLRLGPVRVRLPNWIAPRVHLTERFSGDTQLISLTLDVPAIGRVYEYSGSFIYRLEEQS